MSQNSSTHISKVMLCIKKRDKQTDRWMNGPEAICPSNFFEVWGIMLVMHLYMCIQSNLFQRLLNLSVKRTLILTNM